MRIECIELYWNVLGNSSDYSIFEIDVVMKWLGNIFWQSDWIKIGNGNRLNLKLRLESNFESMKWKVWSINQMFIWKNRKWDESEIERQSIKCYVNKK